MKILQICAAYKPAYIYGGPTLSVSMLSEQLVKVGVNVEVYTTTADGKKELPVIAGQTVNVDGVKVTYFTRLTKDHTHYSPALLKRVWKEARSFDLIHIHAWWNLVSLMACAAALIRGVPVLLSPRGTLSAYSFSNKNIGPKQIIHSLIGRFLLTKCKFHVTSQNELNAVAGLIHPKSIFVLPNFIKLPSKPLYPAIFPGVVLKLIFFSRIEEKKGLDLLIRALALVKVPYQLTVAGDGNESYIDSLKALAVENKVAKQIVWIGFQSGGKFDLLQQHDLFVLPSHDENFGNVVIESLSVGTPVLVSENVGLVDYVTANHLGWVCKTTINSIAQSIMNAAADQSGLKRIRNSAPEIIYNDFNEDTLVKKYIHMYKELLNNGRV